MRTDRWKAVALVLLGICLTVVFLRRGDGWGGDRDWFIASARDVTGPSPYPPGMAFVLAPFSHSMLAMRMVMLAMTMGLVTAMWLCAVRLGGWRSGAAAGVLMLASPTLLANGSSIMSDRFGALPVVLGLLALIEGRTILAGVLVAGAGWVRIAHLLFCAALPRRGWPAAAVVGGLLFAWQLIVKGQLVGYTGEQASWALSNIVEPTWLEAIGAPAEVPNFAYYLGVVLVGFGGWVCPLAIVAAVLGMRRHWGDAARFAAWVIVLNLVLYVPFFFQTGRYVVTACCMVTVFAAASGSQGERRTIPQHAASSGQRTRNA